MYAINIGLEIHVQLNTQSKAFCGDKNAFGDKPNTNVSSISLGLPGSLPMLNEKQLEYAVKLGLALESEINLNSSFDRKNYVYPDLPKAYQITQDKSPICLGGKFSFKSGEKWKSIRIHHLHMEEDAGKSDHELHDKYSCIDYNRAGTPLLEVVTEPDFTSAQEVQDFMGAFQNLVRFLEISDANMEEGSMRADCNVSVRPVDQRELGTRTEIKNLNSKKFARQAIEFEADRQWNLLQNGQDVVQESRLFNSKSGETFAMRKKEDALDYRYFPDPDLGILKIDDKYVSEIAHTIDLIPEKVFRQLSEKYGITEKTAEIIIRDKDSCKLFYAIAKRMKNYQLIANFIVNQSKSIDIEAAFNDDNPLLQNIILLLKLIDEGKISSSAAYKVLVPKLMNLEKVTVTEIAKQENLYIDSNLDSQEAVCQVILDENPDKCAAYRKGNKNLIGFFMGQFMRQNNKAVNPQDIQKTFEQLLNISDDNS